MRLGNIRHKNDAKTANAVEALPLRRRGPLLCGEVLQQPVLYIDVADTLSHAANMMREHNIGFLPVCEAEGTKLVGVLTDRDIVTRACVSGARALESLIVRDVMTRGALTVCTDDSVMKALRLMRKHRVSRVIVTADDDADFPIGVISLSDIAQYEKPTRIGRTLRAISERKYAPERP